MSHILSVLSAAYQNEQLEDGSERVVLRIPPVLAPYKAAVLPLVKKDGLPEKAREIMKALQFDYSIQYDEKDSIGKRYRRQDAIGTPFSITIDHQTLSDDTVTVRDRDTMEQIRISMNELDALLAKKASWKSVLSTL
jgi:glycyl-tRNA synthetase